MKKYSTALRKRFTGSLEYWAGRVAIEKVVVIPQPLGTLVAASANRQKEFDRDSAHLVVDVGFFTPDWVYANGFTMNDKRSDGLPGGASHIYQRIASLIARDQDEQVDDIERIVSSTNDALQQMTKRLDDRRKLFAPLALDVQHNAPFPLREHGTARHGSFRPSTGILRPSGPHLPERPACDPVPKTAERLKLPSRLEMAEQIADEAREEHLALELRGAR